MSLPQRAKVIGALLACFRLGKRKPALALYEHDEQQAVEELLGEHPADVFIVRTESGNPRFRLAEDTLIIGEETLGDRFNVERAVVLLLDDQGRQGQWLSYGFDNRRDVQQRQPFRRRAQLLTRSHRNAAEDALRNGGGAGAFLGPAQLDVHYVPLLFAGVAEEEEGIRVVGQQVRHDLPLGSHRQPGGQGRVDDVKVAVLRQQQRIAGQQVLRPLRPGPGGDRGVGVIVVQVRPEKLLDGSQAHLGDGGQAIIDTLLCGFGHGSSFHLNCF